MLLRYSSPMIQAMAYLPSWEQVALTNRMDWKRTQAREWVKANYGRSVVDQVSGGIRGLLTMHPYGLYIDTVI